MSLFYTHGLGTHEVARGWMNTANLWWHVHGQRFLLTEHSTVGRSTITNIQNAKNNNITWREGIIRQWRQGKRGFFWKVIQRRRAKAHFNTMYRTPFTQCSMARHRWTLTKCRSRSAPHHSWTLVCRPRILSKIAPHVTAATVLWPVTRGWCRVNYYWYWSKWGVLYQ